MPAKSLALICQEFAAESSREQLTGDKVRAKLRSTLFPKQLEFVYDHAHQKRAACCGRRSGKTQGIIRRMLEKCLETPKAICAYFGINLKSAARITWDSPDGIPTLIRDYGIDAVCEVNETNHRVSFANGSVLWIAGAETLSDAKNWKGLRYDIAVLDEAQDWPDDILEYMIATALSWALADRVGSELMVTGTPAPFLGGVFYEICTGARPGWGVKSWTMLDNPHMPNPQAFITKECRERGLSFEDPVVQREFFGRWVRDASTLLYQYLPVRNDYAVLPPGQEWRHVLGMDVGVRDLATFVIESYRRYDPTVYIQDVHGERDADTSRVAEIIRGFQVKYGRELRLIMDCGALGLLHANELRNRKGLNIIAAKKTEKASAIRLMNDQFRLGAIKVGPGAKPLTDQWQKLQIDPKTQIEKTNAACDYADGALYGWRDCWAFLAQPEPDDSAAAVQRRNVERIVADRVRAAQGRGNLERERREMEFRGGYDGD